MEALLEAGADIAGIARTDEFAYSLNGTNAHYGTPPNPAAPGRVPGGSSNGPASAVALGQADVGLGSDTGGSVRVPASYCGLYGMRPTHGAVPVDGMLPLSPAFDTVAWLAREAETLAAVGGVLLPPAAGQPQPLRTALVAQGLAGLADPAVADAFGPVARGFAAAAGLHAEAVSVPSGADAERWAVAFAVVQGAQAWESDGEWVVAHPGTLGAGVAQRFATAARVTPGRRAEAEAVLREAAGALGRLLRPDRLLLLPAASGPAPWPEDDGERRTTVRAATFRLTCLASLAGLPSAAMPGTTVDGLPVGLCAIGPPGSDHALLALLDRAAGHR